MSAEACHPDVPRQYAIGVLRHLTARPTNNDALPRRKIAARRFGHELMNIKRANPGELPRSLILGELSGDSIVGLAVGSRMPLAHQPLAVPADKFTVGEPL